MKAFNLSLRTKSLLALVVACLVALGPTVFIGWQMLETGRTQLGRGFAQNFTLLRAQKIKEPVSRELALAQRFADSVLLRQWLRDDASHRKRSLFFQEADGYQEAFQGSNYFVVNQKTLAYYYNGADKEYGHEPRYHLDPDNPDDIWFFTTMEDFDSFTINVNPDVHLGNVQVWIDVIIWNNGHKIGMAGTGLELSAFLKDFIAADEPGVTPMILDAQGLIQAHPNKSLIAFGSGAEATNQNSSSSQAQSSLQNQLTGASGGDKLTQAMQQAQENPGSVETFRAGLDGKEQLLALTWIPELSWYVVSAVNLQAAQVIDDMWIMTAVAAVLVMFGILLLVYGYGVEKLVLRPLGALHSSATALAHGDYNVSLPLAGKDEIGGLSRAFGSMVEEIKSHTSELENKVSQRTRELEEQSKLLQEANQAKTEMLNNVMESIHYARTIQQAILTSETHLQQMVPECFTIWQPKDVISGDMIWSKAHEDGFAAAVIDCTGHGVPGGIMTMAAVASLNRVVSDIGVQAPHRVLQEVSRLVQKMLSKQDAAQFSEDGLDMALCVYCRSSRNLLFAGSRLSLWYEHDDQLVQIKGDKESLGYRSSNPDFPFKTHAIRLQGPMTFYLATDGIFDQIGTATGLPLGYRRLHSFLQTIRDKPLAEQKKALLGMYENYRGAEEQRDDVTVLGLRLTA
ncbi:MAG: biofilm regulation protein phosphatase SiaA [Desulfohalobiaceae bacterium]|nr:biofilm regulation protein phosphatase SiaA [Desulfohalobiaceae bacterium]